MRPCWGAGCLDPACHMARWAGWCSQLLLVVMPTIAQPAACLAVDHALASCFAQERVVVQVEWARCGPGAAAACGNLLTRFTGCRPAAVHGRRRMLLRQRAEQAAEHRGAVQAHAAEGPHPQHALPVHPAAVGVAARCGAGARTRARLPWAVQEQGPGLASRTCAGRQPALHRWRAAAACSGQPAHASLRPVPQITCCCERAPRCLCSHQGRCFTQCLTDAQTRSKSECNSLSGGRACSLNSVGRSTPHRSAFVQNGAGAAIVAARHWAWARTKWRFSSTSATSLLAAACPGGYWCGLRRHPVALHAYEEEAPPLVTWLQGMCEAHLHTNAPCQARAAWTQNSLLS
jgi:hypothetical protein